MLEIQAQVLKWGQVVIWLLQVIEVSELHISDKHSLALEAHFWEHGLLRFNFSLTSQILSTRQTSRAECPSLPYSGFPNTGTMEELEELFAVRPGLRPLASQNFNECLIVGSSLGSGPHNAISTLNGSRRSDCNLTHHQGLHTKL
ncbi:hypothetical protein FKM82_006430 [Ascaphus truei]